jgi:hypothetical protein
MERSGAEWKGMERGQNDVAKWGMVWNGVDEVCTVICGTRMGIRNG